MGTTLTGTTPQDTYDSLIKVTDNGPLSGTAKYLSDGLGNDSALALSTARVGVSSATPRLNLMVRAADAPTTPTLGTASGHFLLGNGATTVDYGLMFGTNNDGNSWIQSQRVDAIATAYNLLLQPSGGNVGIGTSTPVGTLDVGGTGAGGGDLLVTTGSTTALVTVGRLSSTGSDNTNFLVQNRVGSTAFFVNSGEIKVGVGTNSPAVPLDVVGNIRSSTGILFGSDTAAANALDDYEEGTWTPVFGGQTTAGSYSYSIGGGAYRKIGSQVTLWGSIVDIVESSAGSGIWVISGLPFTPSSDQRLARGNGSLYVRQAATTRTGLTVLFYDGIANIYPSYNNGSSDSSSFTIADDFATNMDIGFTITYYV